MPRQSATRESVLVVGGGWAGLAAAVALCRQGMAVTLLEAAPRLGGRARGLTRDGRRLDNGQHLIIGAYRALRELWRLLGVDETRLVSRHSLCLEMLSSRTPWQLALPPLPAPLHLLVGLGRARGLMARDRRAALRLCLALGRYSNDGDDEPLGAFLARHGQPDTLQRRLWEPLCLAMLNTPLEIASTRIFAATLRDVFTRRRGDSDLLIPRGDLDELLPEPARRFLAGHGATIHLQRRVVDLEIQGDVLRAVITARGERHQADHFVLALPPLECLRLIRAIPRLAPLQRRLEALRHAPIATVYLRYPPDTRLPRPMVGLLDGTGQWLFDRRWSGQPGLMAVVVSGPGPHEAWSREELARCVAGEVAARFPHWPAAQGHWVIREKRATFLCHHGIQALRPGVTTALSNCWLAGDHLDTGYPATLEGAVRSGLQCAQSILTRSRPAAGAAAPATMHGVTGPV